MTETLKNFVNATFIPATSSATMDLVDPTDGSFTGRSPISGPDDIDNAVTAAESAFRNWRFATPRARQAALLRLTDAVEANASRLAAAQSRNTGQPTAMILAEEVITGADHLRFFAGAARTQEGRSAGEYLEGHTSYIRREPLGVIGQVTPWNYPLLMAIWKIAPAVAAGNCVVIKPSDTTPESTLILAELTQKILPDGVLNVVLGDRSTGAALLDHPSIAMVAITGSVRAGIEVAGAAGRQLKLSHLELGGNAPAVVFADADISTAAQKIAEAGMFNAGQDCTAASRVLVHESKFNQFLDELVTAAAGLRPGAPADPDAFYGPLNNKSHFSAVMGKLGRLPATARIHTGGNQVGSAGYYLAPTVISGVAQSDEIVQGETFGPVLTVQAFTDEAHAISLANGVDYGLAASVWTTNHALAQRMTAQLDFGAVWVNCHIPLVAEMPHGGFKNSGHGKDLSVYGLADYTRIKHVMSTTA